MTNGKNRPRIQGQAQPRWSIMIILSLTLHLVVFSLVFFVPDSFPSRRINDTFYEVDLVEMPREGELGPTEIKGEMKSGRVPTAAGENKSTQLIRRPKSQEKPIPIAKRTLKTKKNKPEIEETFSKLLDKAVSKLEKEIEAKKLEDKHEASKDIKTARQDSKEGIEEETGPASGTTQGISMEIYKRQVESRIAQNWSYPVALADWDTTETLEAIIILNVRSDGTVIDFSFEKRSANTHFDQSVLKAVKKTESLPRFPLGYHESKEELVITFNLKELLGN